MSIKSISVKELLDMGMKTNAVYEEKAAEKLLEYGILALYPGFTDSDVSWALDGHLVLLIPVEVFTKHSDPEKALESMSSMVCKATWFMRKEVSDCVLRQTTTDYRRYLGVELVGKELRFKGDEMCTVGELTQILVTIRLTDHPEGSKGLVGSAHFDLLAHPLNSSANTTIQHPPTPPAEKDAPEMRKFTFVNVYSQAPAKAEELMKKLEDLEIRILSPETAPHTKLPLANVSRHSYYFTVVSDEEAAKLNGEIDEMMWIEKFHLKALQKPLPFFWPGHFDGIQFVRAVLLATHFVDSGIQPAVTMSEAFNDRQLMGRAVGNREVVKTLEASLIKPGRIFLTEIKQEARGKASGK